VVLSVAGIVLVRLIYFPDTEITIGVGTAKTDTVRVRAVLLEFETPTVEHMHGYASVDSFDAWVAAYVTEHLPDAGRLPVVRVSSFADVQTDTILHHAVPWSGFRNLRMRMVPPQRGFLWETWGVAAVPYAAVTVLRLMLRFIRKIA
jgi:hypothetical protein